MTDIVDTITKIVGSGGILTGDDVSARPAGWLRPSPTRARAIVRPATTDEVAEVIRACYDIGQSIVPIGGNTGLVDGTLSNESDILLSLERMKAIEAVDTVGCTMTVQAGVPLQFVHEAAEAEGLMFPLDLGARGSCTIGGNISTNAGGNSVIRYGMMREQVLGLEAVLADGTILSSMNRMLKNNAGYDLKQLFIGTEGTLGIVTRAVLRLRPALRSQNTAFVAVDDFNNISSLLNELGASLGGSLTAFEVMWADFYETIVDDSGRHQPPVSAGHPYYVLIEARGGDQDVDAERFQAALEEAFENALIVDAAFAQSVQQRRAMWAIRDDIDGLVEKLGPTIAFDVSLPIGNAENYAASVNRSLAERWPDTFRGTTFGHLGDSNMHFLLTIGSEDYEQQQQAMEIVYRELRPYGGSVSAEHGIGLEKKPFLHHSRNDIEIALMKNLKQAFDPDGILNPGKVFS
ncbi:MAG: FAD-binding oxidoreductase [Gammaproteobacteria bacterium]|nr:FAD-binding oxidoreductase [Gammaproteobacteria bacterium]